MSNRILTLHPEGKEGTNIDTAKYAVIKSAILDALDAHQGISFGALTQVVVDKLGKSFDGSISWYVTTVKLDLEARGLIERVPGSKPQRVRRTANHSK